MSPFDQNPYLILRPAGLVCEAPEKLLCHFEMVRRASEWIELGFKLKMDQYGIPSAAKSQPYVFFVAFPSEAEVAEAIKSGKKAVRHPTVVFEYFSMGVKLDDFISLPEDVRYYCEGNRLRLDGKLSQALPLLEKACELNPNEVRYREIYYPLRLELGDLKSIDDELGYFAGDADSLVHTGRVDQWIKALLQAGSFEHARAVLRKVDESLLELESGNPKTRHYGRQKAEWYRYKRQQFSKQAEKLNSRIDRAEQKKGG